MLGGYASADGAGGSYLLPELPELERVPDQTMSERTYERYRIFWPRSPAEGEPMHQSWTGAPLNLRWVRARLTYPAGRVDIAARKPRSPHA